MRLNIPGLTNLSRFSPGRFEKALSFWERYPLEILLLLLGVTFALLTCLFFAPSLSRFLGFPLVLIFGGVFFFLGIFLVRAVRKRGVDGKLRKFLLLTGFSAAGFLSGVVLHNFFYAVGVLFGGILVLKYLMEAVSVIFFLASVFVSPLGFLLGILGSSLLIFKKRRS
jgi:hypothetical protein